MLVKVNGHREECHDMAIASVRKGRGKPCDGSPKAFMPSLTRREFQRT
jgi:hypothetical protein